MGSQTRLQGQLLNIIMRPSMLPWLFTEEPKNACPTIEGMFDTLCKRSKLEDMTKLVSSNEKLQARVASDHWYRKIRSFETSNENVLHSIPYYYSRGVMGKRKYKSVSLFWQQTPVQKKARQQSTIVLYAERQNSQTIAIWQVKESHQVCRYQKGLLSWRRVF